MYTRSMDNTASGETQIDNKTEKLVRIDILA